MTDRLFLQRWFAVRRWLLMLATGLFMSSAGLTAVAADPAANAGADPAAPPAATPGATAAAAPAAGAALQVPDTLAQRLMACTACHGKDGRAATDGFYPRIAGKPAGYLLNQLRNFREGRRQYPLMIYMVQHQSDAYLQEIATYFASLHPPYALPQPATVDPAVLARGAQLVRDGDPTRQVPACMACHGAALTGVAPAVPGLVGLPRDYISAQIGAWRNGSRHTAGPDCMATIASRLSLADVGAAAAWLAAQPVPADAAVTATAAPPSKRLPLDCGSVNQSTAALR